MLKTYFKCTLLVLILVLMCGLVFGVDANAAEAVRQTYPLTYGIEDDPATPENETAISMELVSLYGEQEKVSWRLEADENCSFLLALFMDQTRIVVYTSTTVRPLNASSILDNTGVTHYYYLEATRCYMFPIDITVDGETITAYFRESYSPEMFEAKETKPDKNENKVPSTNVSNPDDSTTEDNASNSTTVPNHQLDALYDYMDQHTKQIRALYIIAILIIVLLVFTLVICLYNINQVKRDRAIMEAELERFTNINKALEEKKVQKRANKK